MLGTGQTLKDFSNKTQPQLSEGRKSNILLANVATLLETLRSVRYETKTEIDVPFFIEHTSVPQLKLEPEKNILFNIQCTKTQGNTSCTH